MRGVVAGQVFSRREIACSATARVEDEVGVAIVERTVFDDLILRTVNTAETEVRSRSLTDFILETSGQLINGLRFEAGIERRRGERRDWLWRKRHCQCCRRGPD